MHNETRSRPKYDFSTAVTFLLAGLAVGWVAALLFPPRYSSALRRPSVAEPLGVPGAKEALFQ